MSSLKPTPASPAQKIAVQFAEARQLQAAGQLTKADEICHQLLIQEPDHQGALHLRVIINRDLARFDNAESLLQRLESLTGADNTDVLYEWGLLRYHQGRQQEAEAKLRALLKTMPDHANGHMVFGRLCDQQGRLGEAEIHLRQALNLRPDDETICKDMASICDRLGLVETGIRFARRAYNLNPNYIDSLLIWAKLEETNKDYDKAEQLIDYACQLQPGEPLIEMMRAFIQRRRGNFEQAYAILEPLEMKQLTPGARAITWQERGFCLERLGRFDEAFDAFGEMSKINRQPPINRNYPEEVMQDEFDQLHQFWETVDINTLASVKEKSNQEPVPVFILGFPRSGTTMVEQIITSHPEVIAGDETHSIDKAMGRSRGSSSETSLIHASQQLVGGKNESQAMQLRQKYFRQIRRLAVLEPGIQLFTDKTPLNEIHMGMIHTILPEAPMIHLIRHPLNVVLSSYFNDVRHGRGFSTRLETTAAHYAHTMDMVELYNQRLKMRYLAVRYEDIVADLEVKAKEITKFIGLPWDERCLNFHENERHVRTASASQVKEKLYTRSLERYKPFLKHLEPVIPILEPYIEKFGYTI